VLADIKDSMRNLIFGVIMLRVSRTAAI